ncbi:copper transporter [Streptosporangium sp. NPDC000396]|uniref:copper transporter n=1 Tax=Streptosporangium sp. NPDC000396 TaxID=3366185 RepID=UPI0036A9EEC3
MIDFRYHLVSIVAIFLALSVGIVLGTTFLEKPAIKAAESLANQLRVRNDEYRTELEALQKRQVANDRFVAAHGSQLVQGVLTGERVVIVEAPGAASSTREAVEQTISESGATVTGRIALTEKYVDVSQVGSVGKVATGAKLTDLITPSEGKPYDRAAEMLANAIMTGDPAQVGKETPVTADVLGAFQREGLLTIADQPVKRAELAVLIAPAEPYAGEAVAQQTGAIMSMAAGLDEAGRGAVLTGTLPAATAGGVVAALREDAAAEKVSTVDNADMPVGRVAVVYALREQLSGTAGQYGIGPGVSGAEPSVSPAPTATSGG